MVGSDPSLPERPVAEARAALSGLADAGRAEPMAAYMKGRFAFFGVPSPQRRAAQKPVIDQLTGANASSSSALARGCWAAEERELQYVAADALRRHQVALGPGDLTAVSELITTRSWWDTVDELAIHVVGPLVRRHPELVPAMDAWVSSDDIWLARTAILHQLLYQEATDPTRLFAYADQRAADTELFIRKALGWALRQYARVDPEAVRAYVASRGDRLSGLTRREALKRL
jgi:3-methyladenine DNA glycosylase AlkD